MYLASPQKATDTQDRTAPIGIVQPGRDEEEANEPFTSSGALPGLRKALATALKTELPKQAAPIIEYLVGNLDESGYLRCSVEETARILRVPVGQVEEVLASLHMQKPGGIGARDVRECFLLQLRYLEARGQSQPYAVEIVSRFLPELAQQKYGFIARQVGISRRQVKQVQCFLKQWLTPFPASRLDERRQNFAGKR
jgi:RNA polymerase sigma-54 factor